MILDLLSDRLILKWLLRITKCMPLEFLHHFEDVELVMAMGLRNAPAIFQSSVNFSSAILLTSSCLFTWIISSYSAKMKRVLLSI